MQMQSDKSANRMDEIKTQFKAREGCYKLMNSPDYSQRSQRAMGFSSGTTNSNSSTLSTEKTFIKISLVTVNDANKTTSNLNSFSLPRQIPLHIKSKGARDKKICFNVGRELFVYNYDGVKRGPDASNPIYKRSYKGSLPTCHDFNQATANQESISLIVGFSHGQVQLIDLNGRVDQEHVSFNVDRLIDKTRVTCVKWLPNSPSLFLVAHASGQLYLYKDDLPCGNTAPTYQIYKQSEGVIVYTCKTKTIRNPIYKWTIGSKSSLASTSSVILETESCSLNEFVFSPCGKYLACVSQDGFLRVYCYDTMELIGHARSYYGGLSCVCWSPDGKYVVTGGEDDLITVWSFLEKRVAARGIGHKSWVSVVAFDSFYSGYDFKETDAINDDDDDDIDDDNDDEESRADKQGDSDEDDEQITVYSDLGDVRNKLKMPDISSASYPQGKHCRDSPPGQSTTSYRFGSVGQDTQLCLWDLNDDLINQPIAKHKSVVISPSMSGIAATTSNCPVPDGSSKTLQNESDPQQSASTMNSLPSFKRTSNNLSEQQQQEKNSDSYQKSSNANPQAHEIVASKSPLSIPNPVNLTQKENAAGGILSSSSFSRTFGFGTRRDKKNASSKNVADKTSVTKGQNSSSSNACSSGIKFFDDPTVLLGTPICPRMNEVPILEPTICKKISFERLTSLIFCKGGFITSCQDGYVFSWARPSRRQMKISPSQSNEELRVIDVGTSSIV